MSVSCRIRHHPSFQQRRKKLWMSGKMSLFRLLELSIVCHVLCHMPLMLLIMRLLLSIWCVFCDTRSFLLPALQKHDVLLNKIRIPSTVSRYDSYRYKLMVKCHVFISRTNVIQFLNCFLHLTHENTICSQHFLSIYTLVRYVLATYPLTRPWRKNFLTY